MKKLYFLILLTIFFLATSSDNPEFMQVYYFNYENVLGTSFTLKVTAKSESAAAKAEASALGEIGRLSGILNTYDPESEFRQWQNTLNSDVYVSPELFEVMSLFEKWQLKTGGVLNPAVGTATDIWKKADETDLFPSQTELSDAVDVLNRNHWILNEEKMTARHLTTDPLVFNTFVKSFIINKVSDEVMKVDGITSSLVNIGGDIVTAGKMEENIGVADPEHFSDNNHPLLTIHLSNRAVATSGNYRRGFMIGDEWYSHILDARTAMPANEIISATVVSENAVDAGALATAFNILSPEESMKLSKQIPDVEFLIIAKDGSQVKSEGWDDLEFKENNGIVAPESGPDHVLNIEFELTRFPGRSLRPYVAVWVENEKSEPVRTLALWFNNYRWLPDLRRWYAKHYEKAQQYDFMQSITSATRSAGKYTLNWDLKDNNGKPVKSGKYTVCIEASREHGTYQLISKEIELNKKPQRIDIEGGTEISSATLDYTRVNTNKASL
jgi:thiamine biosynthesis lipoprotein